MKKIIMYLSAFLPMFWLILIKDYATILKNAIAGEVPYSDLLNRYDILARLRFSYHEQTP